MWCVLGCLCLCVCVCECLCVCARRWRHCPWHGMVAALPRAGSGRMEPECWLRRRPPNSRLGPRGSAAWRCAACACQRPGRTSGAARPSTAREILGVGLCVYLGESAVCSRVPRAASLKSTFFSTKRGAEVTGSAIINLVSEKCNTSTRSPNLWLQHLLEVPRQEAAAAESRQSCSTSLSTDYWSRTISFTTC